MDLEYLSGLVITRSAAEHHECVQVSGTRFIPEEEWKKLKRHEKELVRCFAVATSARKAVLVGRSAARAQGMWVLAHDAEIVELAQREGRPPSKSQWPEKVIYRRVCLPDRDVGEGQGMRYTQPARTAVDIARFHTVRDGVVAMDSVCAKRLATHRDIEAVIRRLGGKHGIAKAREALSLSSAKSESPFETLLRVILAENGIPVEEQMWIGDFRTDLLWGNLIIEIDGRMKFEDTPHETVLKQLERENWLKEQGYEVIRFFPSEILKDEAACVQRVLRAKLLADARVPLTPATPYRRAR